MISVVVPVFNVEKYLRRCLDSVLVQTYENWELICVNDGSTDRSAAILAEYAARDRRIRVIAKNNAGVSAARNDGLAAARGKFVLFLDSDDFIHPQTLEITREIARKSGADIVSFRHDAHMYRRIRAGMGVGIRVPATARTRKYDVARVRYKYTDSLIRYATERNHAFGRWRVRHCYPVMHLYSRDFIAGVTFDTDIKITEDFPWWTRVIFAHPRTAITRLPLYYYVPHWSSALNKAGATKLYENVGLAIVRAYCAARISAGPHEMARWQREFLWPFIITCARAIRGCGGDINTKDARMRLIEMERMGCFDNPSGFRAWKYRRWIRCFIRMGK